MKRYLRFTTTLAIILLSYFIIGCQSSPVTTQEVVLSKDTTSAKKQFVSAKKPALTQMQKNIMTVQDLQNMSVLIASQKSDGSASVGTGVITKRNGRAYVWTVAHTFEHQPKLKISPEKLKELLDTGKPPEIPKRKFGKVGETCFVTIMQRIGSKVLVLVTQGTVLAISPSHQHDLALLELSIPSKLIIPKGVEWYDKRIMAGMDVYHIGNMVSDFGWSATKGIVSYDLRVKDGASFFQTDHMAVPGCSGGGVFLQDSKQCLGLMAWINQPGINFGIPFYRVKQFAKDNGYEWLYDHKLPIPEKMPENYPEIPTDKEAEKQVEDYMRKHKLFGADKKDK